MLNLYNSLKSVVLETANIDSIFSEIGPFKSLNIATLRGNKPKSGLFEYKHGHLLLSSYDLNMENVKNYVELIEKYNINCLHVYPSTIHILCKHLEALKDTIEIPDIKGIFSSSEILSFEDKKLIMNTFKDVILIDEYGQNEHVALGYSINYEFYNFIRKYSHIEFIDTGKKCRKNRIFEIVGTGYINELMPLI